MTHCRACSEPTIYPLWIDKDGQQWFRCCSCGSDCNAKLYEHVRSHYDAAYIHSHHGGITFEDQLRELRPNLDWFVDWKIAQEIGKDFLDVGHCEGAALTGMQDRGFSVHGFDVNPSANLGPHTTIKPFFAAAHFPQQYHAVLCREVIEHVETPMQFLTELHLVTARGGFLQLQTPRPAPEKNPIGYQFAHLVLLSPLWIRYWLERLGFEIKDYRFWAEGQTWLCKKR